jgi:hypothetical protein
MPKNTAMKKSPPTLSSAPLTKMLKKLAYANRGTDRIPLQFEHRSRSMPEAGEPTTGDYGVGVLTCQVAYTNVFKIEFIHQ